MKKIFTIAAALLASFSLWAADPDFESYDWSNEAEASAVAGNHDGIVVSYAGLGSLANVSGHWYIPNNQNLKNSDSSWKYFGVSASSPIDSIAILYCPNGSNKTTIAWVAWGQNVEPNQYVLAHGETAGTTSSKSWDNAIWETIDLSDVEAYTVYTSRSVREFREIGATSNMPNFGGGQTINILGIRVWLASGTPSADPVSSVVIAGPEATYVGKVASYTASPDKKASVYKWTVNDVEQNGETSAKFEYTPAAAGTYTIKAYAKNEYNADWVASNAIALVASEKTIQPTLNPVDASLTWDFNQIAAVNVQHENQTDTVIFANLNADWAEGFAADKLAGCAQYFYYTSNKCFQGTQLMFVTSVPGKVSLEYSNTGGDRPYRYAEVNGVRSQTGSASTTKITSEEFAVEAGEVIIKFYIADANDPKAKEGQDVGYTMGRVYKLIFKDNNSGTGIENTDAAVKAVKVVRNGQMFIQKNGVLYNMQGAIVK